MARSDWVYDELLTFLGNPLFQVPVLTFMEANCIIFDPSIEDCKEYREQHTSYHDLINTLLDGFRKDSKLSHEDIINAFKEMNAKDDLKEIFQVIFEMVLAMDDFSMFVRIMTLKNIELQEQVLRMMAKTTGSIPDSFTTAPPKKAKTAEEAEEELLAKVMEQSKKEYEIEEKKRKTMEKEELANVMVLEQNRLQNEKVKEHKKYEQAIQDLSQGSTPTKPVQDKLIALSISQPKPQATQPTQPQPVAQPVTSKPPPAKPVKQTDLKAAPSVIVTPSRDNVSSSEAAANWLAQAKTDIPSSSNAANLNAAHAALSKLSPDELKQRQEYLKQQRDKLVAMKKKEREKQLLAAEQTQPQRPVSARNARSALQGDQQKKVDPEEEKKLAMRKAIANRLKSELLGNN
ncbi:cilia- and flagella-associated protein 36-like [Mytilus galloprovincialis]|uniref:Cilia- and flagella-associated protein 36 n=1 Tax=Mytilus edulis TaxID=6550 RepID=A0A8S3VL89_MYTED|nr:unnamed protein product [Mytilus edulis]